LHSWSKTESTLTAPTLDTAAADFLVAAAERVIAGYPDLFRHQATGVAFLLSRRRAILADDMGLGKTRTAIVAAREQSPNGRVLVICPASMKHGWRREIAVIEPDAPVEILGPGAPGGPARWTVVNYDRLTRHAEWLMELRPDVVIVDEAHFIKNRSARSNRTLSLVAVNPDAAAYLLTGTPMTNRPRDLFNLLKAVDHPSAKSFFSFAQRYCAAHDNGYGLQTDGASNVEELAQVVSGVMLRRTKDEVLDLPEKVRTWLPIEVKSDRIRELELRALAFLSANPSRGGSTWVTFLGLLNKARHQLATAKAPETARFVSDLVEAGQKVVVFTSYQAAVDRMLKEFGDRAVALTGSHTSDERDEAVQRFQDDEQIRVFVGNLQAAGTGITLTAGTHVVFNDLDWVPANHWQAEDRIHRIGQTQPTFATYLSAPGTLDEFVAQLLEAKAALVGVVERESEARSTMVADLVDAALDGLDPYAVEPARTETRHTVGLLEETLALLQQFAPEGLTAIQQGVSVHTFPSSSAPGKSYTVEVSNGVARCDCPGFSYRGNCRHAREALAGG
jgi:SWI/SNF-related matrix-associated actin-dependent regulator 1 of chromatin subfamily A